MPFVHLHVHTEYSILDGASKIKKLLEAAEKDGQPALAITDHGNMFGAKEFLDTAKKMKSSVKPIVGCEVYVARGSRSERKGREDQSSFHLILLAKNMTGYHNLIKMVSKGYIEGFHYKPRIDHDLLEQYHEGIICSSACLGGEVPQAIMAGDIAKAEETILWYRSLFGEDYYLEVQRHETDVPGADTSTFIKQQEVNKVIFELAAKHGIKVIATNDVHFVLKEDGPAHDRLICLSTNAEFDDPNRLHYTQQEYLKSADEMSAIFSDHPEVIANTLEIADKVELIDLNHDAILPVFPLPEGFSDSNDYLRHLTYEGAKERYGEDIPQGHKERIDFELATIKKMGFPDYFLIVQDFIRAARGFGVWVGPGRGSAAGSAVAYCLTITDIDPIKYDLLFERFLNPDRISMPDIDIDFDDEGRYKVFKYVEDKYGKDHVSHVVTFGTMGTKSVIRDIGRIEKVPLQETDRLAKLVPRSIPVQIEVEEDDPQNPGQKIKKRETKEKDPTINLCIEKVQEFKDAMASGDEIVKETLLYAGKLEGTVRNTGVHACATIIGRGDLTDYIPICTAKDKDTGKDILVSQFEGTLIESAGMLKMDFLGLKTLSIMRDAVENIKHSKGIDLDIFHIPIDDPKTYELFSRGDTVGVFQFESDGMQKWLKQLKPSRFADLIAMNALYRPGPMDYIPDFIDRKMGVKKIEYDIEDMKEYLEDTYGITVYQEQVMLLSQKLAGFTKGQADKLRKAMGKKQLTVLEELRDKFFDGGRKNGHPEDILNKIWNDWKAFAQYAFNKSHATCYAWVGYQTGYLKAHYTAEYMAAVLSNNLNNIEEITKFMDDCRRHNLEILGPDINESYTKFTVNKRGALRFGMGGIKGIGSNAVDAIIATRNEGGPFKDMFDFVERVSSATINKKGVESLAASGAFDAFEDINRGTFSIDVGKGDTFMDTLLRYGSQYQKAADSLNNSIFGFGDVHVETSKPPVPLPPELNQIEMLKREKEVVGMYLSSHPLDRYSFEVREFSNTRICDLAEITEKTFEAAKNPKAEQVRPPKEGYIIAGLVTGVEVRQSKQSNRPWCKLTLEDYSGSTTLSLFGRDYETYLPFVREHEALLIGLEAYVRYPFLTQEQKQEMGFDFRSKLQPTGCEMKIKGMTLLSNARERFVKDFVIDIPTHICTPEFNKSFVSVVKSNKGGTQLSIRAIDARQRLMAEYFSRKYMIAPNVDFLNYLEANDIAYKVTKEVKV